MSKIKINHIENATITWVKSAEIDTELLAKCDPPFTGDDVFDDVVEFLTDIECIETFCEENEDVLGVDAANQISNMILLQDKNEVYNTSDFSDDVFEDGEDDINAFEVGKL